MSQTITIKLTKASPNTGPFKISTEWGTVLAESISRKQLIYGISYIVDDVVKVIVIESLGKCKFTKTFPIATFSIFDYINTPYVQTITGCVWAHLNNIYLYNNFYGNIHPYIIEYPFTYTYQDEILQNVQDYTKAYTYLPLSNREIFSSNTRIETNDRWFNKAILYNGQQSSGLLTLVSKPQNNLQAYGQYPIFNTNSKTIVFTKSDNFYQYNTFWSVQKDSQVPLFQTSCESLSVDKIINESNMDYSRRSFNKAPLRAKELKIRHILDNSDDLHLVSQFLIAPAQISYK
jgi:hypothetical protein